MRKLRYIKDLREFLKYEEKIRVAGDNRLNEKEKLSKRKWLEFSRT